MHKTTLHVSIPAPQTPSFAHPITSSPASTISAHSAESSRTIGIIFDRPRLGSDQLVFHNGAGPLSGSYTTAPESIRPKTHTLFDDPLIPEKDARVRLRALLGTSNESGGEKRSHRTVEYALEPESLAHRGRHNHTSPSDLLPCPFRSDPLCNKVLGGYEEQLAGICMPCIQAMTPDLELDTSPNLGPFTPTSLLASPARALWLSRFSQVSVPPRKSSLSSMIVKMHESHGDTSKPPAWDEFLKQDSPTSIWSNEPTAADPWELRVESRVSDIPDITAPTIEPAFLSRVTTTADVPLLSPITAKIDSIIDSYKYTTSQWEEQELSRSQRQIRPRSELKSTGETSTPKGLQIMVVKEEEGKMTGQDEQRAKEAYNRHLEKKLRDLRHSQKCHCRQCRKIGKILALACI